MAAGAMLDSRPVTAIACIVTLAAILGAGSAMLSRQAALTGDTGLRLPNILRGFSELLALTCLWAATSLYLCYGASALRWQHGHQYALGFLVLGTAHGLFFWLLNHHGSLERLSHIVRWALRGLLLEVLLSAAALIWLIGSGKLWTIKKDWAANDVFLASGFAVLGLAYILFRDMRRENRR